MTHPHDRLTPRATLHVFGNCGWKIHRNEDGTKSVHFEGELPLSALGSLNAYESSYFRLAVG